MPPKIEKPENQTFLHQAHKHQIGEMSSNDPGAGQMDQTTLRLVTKELKLGSADGLTMAKEVARDAMERGKSGGDLIQKFISRYQSTMTGPNPLAGISRYPSPNVFPNAKARQEIVNEMEKILAETEKSHPAEDP